jgi:5-methylcytosine-specific restriction endonuclease McrA
MSILDKAIVLKTNSRGRGIGWLCVRDAITDMTGGRKTPPSRAWDIEYGRHEDGTPNFDEIVQMRLLPWADWIQLPIREYDMEIPTSSRTIRVPTVITVPHYAEMPMVRQKANRKFYFEREGGLDAYTGMPVSLEEGTLDHVVPRDQGGQSTPTNLVWTALKTNQFKRNLRPEQCGLTLRVRPRAPQTVPIESRIREMRHRDWRHFLRQRN